MGPNAQMRHGLRAAFGNLRVRILLALTSTLLGIAALFYCLVEGWSLVDAIYFSVMDCHRRLWRPGAPDHAGQAVHRRLLRDLRGTPEP